MPTDEQTIIRAYRAVIVAILVASLRDTSPVTHRTRDSQQDLLALRLKHTREELDRLQKKGWISDPAILSHAETVLFDAFDLSQEAIEAAFE